MRRKIEAKLLLRGLRSRLHAVREDLAVDHTPQVTGRLWHAELDLQKAEEAVEQAQRKQPPTPPSSGAENGK